MRVDTIVTQPFRRILFSPALWVVIVAVLFIVIFMPHSEQLLASDKRLITVYVDGKQLTLVSDAQTVGEALGDLDINVTDNDLVEPSVDTPIDLSAFNINIYRAKPVKVVDGDTSTVVQAAYHNPRLVIEHAGIELHEEDEVHSKVVTEFVEEGFAGNKLVIDRATAVTVLVDGQRLSARSQLKTVGDVLDEQGVTLRADDFTRPRQSTHIQSGQTIEVVRVGKEVISVEQEIPFEIRTVIDHNKSLGWQEVRSEGSPGKRLVTHEVDTHNGQVVEKTLLSDTITKEPQNRVIVKGGAVPRGASQDITQIIIDAANKYGVSVERAMRIARCESTFNPNAVNYGYRDPRTGTHPSGLFQHVAGYWPARAARYGYAGSSVFDPVANANVTMGMWRDGSAGLWECS